MYPNNPRVLQKLAIDYVDTGMYEQGIKIFQELEMRFPGNPTHAGQLGYAHGLAGMKEEAQKILDVALERRKRGYFSPWFIAVIYSGLGDKDHAFQWLEKAIEEHDLRLFVIKVVPEFHSLHSDPRFTALLKKMGLED